MRDPPGAAGGLIVSSTSLRLRVDPPYVGESLSSFLGRAAQYYGMDTLTLVHQVSPKETWKLLENSADLDFKPPQQLLARLVETVAGFTSPLENGSSFRLWHLVSRMRTAYCPHCFVDDLKQCRTPYFRMDWAAVVTTHCWAHGTPLMAWKDVQANGLRRVPAAWLQARHTANTSLPVFMQAHLDDLESLRCHPHTPIAEALRRLADLQQLVEHSLNASPRLYTEGHSRLRCAARWLMQFGSEHLCGQRRLPIASQGCPTNAGPWFAPMPLGTIRRTAGELDELIRRPLSLPWRRAMLLFAAKSMTGSALYGDCFRDTGHRTWRQYWYMDLRTRVCRESLELLRQYEKSAARLLDVAPRSERYANVASGVKVTRTIEPAITASVWLPNAEAPRFSL